MTLMLASVLSREEAEIALAHGADIIDCKDPARGALGARVAGQPPSQPTRIPRACKVAGFASHQAPAPRS